MNEGCLCLRHEGQDVPKGVNLQGPSFSLLSMSKCRCLTPDMAGSFPYTHYACPCSDLTSAPTPTSSKRASIQPATFQLNEDQTFNPHSPRANHALYPLDHLLYCDECDAVRCPRCWTEEVLCWYCPSCLFDVPSSAVRGDGNR